jgi:signal-transduction protein with cAMP-binding, CBS, and nucleotidyltransferase domain
MQSIKSNHTQAELLVFLNIAIPGFDKISAAARNKVSHLFRVKVFMPRVKLISEGKESNAAYIIRSGTCILASQKNPLSRKRTGKY